MKPKILVLDIETAPASGYMWKLFDVNISLSQLIDTSKLICFAAKWHGTKNIIFHSNQEHTHKAMVKKAWALLDEADAVVGYNSQNFDMKILHKEFILEGLPPPSPYKNIDLLKTVKSKFRFLSNKLDHVSQELGLGKKTSHQGFELWQKCLEDDSTAWKLMKKYNKQDVVLTEKLYEKLKGWIVTPFNYNNHSHNDVCPSCGSHDLMKNGIQRNRTTSYQRYKCNNCYAYSKSTNSIKDLKRKGTVVTI
jgi:DNA polymerase elongation subunit (family B)